MWEQVRASRMCGDDQRFSKIHFQPCGRAFLGEIPVKVTIVGSSKAAFTHDSSFTTLTCGWVFRSKHHLELRPMVSACRYRANTGCL